MKMYCNSAKVFPNYKSLLINQKGLKCGTFIGNKKTRTEGIMSENSKIIKYTGSRLICEDSSAKEEKIDLDDFSIEVAYMFSERLEKSGLNVRIDFTDKVLPTIRGNQELLKKIFSSVADQCVKEAKPKTTIHLSVQKGKTGCVYEISYQNRDLKMKNSVQMKRFKTDLEKFQGVLSVKREKDTQIRINLNA